MKPIYRISLAILSILLVLTACSAPKSSQNSTQTPGSNGTNQPTAAIPNSAAYPAPGAQDNSANPAQANPNQGANNATAYPGPSTQDQSAQIPVAPFKFDKPLIEGITAITGAGPAGVPIVLTDITSDPKVLGNAYISTDGKFIFKVTVPLVKGQRLGVSLINVKDTPWVDKNFTDPGFQGTEPLQLPNLGFFYDTATVQAK